MTVVLGLAWKFKCTNGGGYRDDCDLRWWLAGGNKLVDYRDDTVGKLQWRTLFPISGASSWKLYL